MCTFNAHIALLFAIQITSIGAVLTDAEFEKCAKLYNQRYNNFYQMANFKLPYWGDVAIPYNVPMVIDATPTMKTRVLRLVTKYVHANPVCIKPVKKITVCKKDDGISQKLDMDNLVTKEYYIQDRSNLVERSMKDDQEYKVWDSSMARKDHVNLGDSDVSLTASEVTDIYNENNLLQTPSLSKHRVQDMLIEDRLDQLETLLPNYTRRRTYETSTLTVTKTLSNRRPMATLIPKNCIPQYFKFCTGKKRKRESKLAKFTNYSSEIPYFLNK